MKILRYPRLHVAIIKEFKDFFHYNPKEMVYTLMAIMAISVLLWPHDPAHSAVELSAPPTQSTPYTHNSSQGAVKRLDEKMMGSYTTTVDLRYMDLKGNATHMGASYSALLGVPYNKKSNGLIPDEVNVTWSQALKKQWNVKLQRDDVTPAARKWAMRIVQTYANSPRDVKGIKTFIKEIDTASKQMQQSINYGQLCHDFKIAYCTQYYQTMDRVGGVNIAAFGMTEIFPSHNGEFNYVMLDTILRNAGENYLNSIPSEGDGLLSLGMFQFTSLAIRRDDSGLLGGVTKIDNYAGQKLAGSVSHLSPSAANKAAFAMAVYNIGQIIRHMDKKDADTLATKCPMEGITSVIAISHHMPSRTWNAARSWVHGGCKKPFVDYVSRRDLKEYGVKTIANLTALQHHYRG